MFFFFPLNFLFRRAFYVVRKQGYVYNCSEILYTQEGWWMPDLQLIYGRGDLIAAVTGVIPRVLSADKAALRPSYPLRAEAFAERTTGARLVTSL